MAARSFTPLVAAGGSRSLSSDCQSVDGAESLSSSSSEEEESTQRRDRWHKYYDGVMQWTGDELRCEKLETHLHLEMHKELVQATFTLMKKVVLLERPRTSSRLTPVAAHCPQLGVDDFRRAYNLVHNWYPQLATVGPKFKEMWRQSKVEMLRALFQLAQNNQLPGQTGRADEFTEWVASELHKEEREVEQNSSRREEVDVELQSVQSGANYEDSSSCCGCQGRRCCGASAVEARRVCRRNLLAMHALMSQSETRTYQGFLQEAFMRTCRVIYIVLVADTFALYESGCMGILMQFFLDLNIRHVGEFVFVQWTTVVSAPVVVVIAAACSSLFLDLTEDALNTPPFKRTCAHFLVVGKKFLVAGNKIGRKILGHDLTERIALSTLFVDGFFTYLLFIFISFAALRYGLGGKLLCLLGIEGATSIQQRGFGNGYLHGIVFGGMVWVMVTWVLYTICWFINSVDLSQQRHHTGNLVQQLMHTIQSYGIHPGFYKRFSVTIDRHLELAEKDDVKKGRDRILEWVQSERERGGANWDDFALKLASIDHGLHLCRHFQGVMLGVLSFIAWPLIYLVFICGVLHLIRRRQILDESHSHVLAVWLCGFFVFFAVVVTAGFLCNLVPKMNTKVFQTHIFVFCLVNFFMCVLSSFHDQAADSSLDVVVWANSTDGFYNDRDLQSGATVNPYPVCYSRWGGFSTSLSIMDISLFAWYSYEEYEADFTRLVHASFGPTVEVLKVTDFDKIPRLAIVRLPDLKEPGSGKGTIVVAVKGTSTMEEAFADLGMYTSMASMQFADKVAPLLHTFPVSVIAWAINVIEVPFSKHNTHRFLKSIKQAVEEVEQAYPNNQVVLTGHSLGGGLAQIAAAQLSRPAVVFSAPGNLFLTKAFSIPKPRVYTNVVSVMPDDDMVPCVDEHVDMVQHIQCVDRRGMPRDPKDCHTMLVTLCELWRVCGDERRRNFSHTCVDQQYVHKECVGKNFGEGLCPPRDVQGVQS